MKKALICGVSGQDGAYLAQLLLTKGYQVWGTSRDAQVANFSNLDKLGVRSQVNVLSMAQSDFRSVLNTLSRSEPDEIYFLSGQSSVGLSFDQPAESIESITYGALNLLEAVRFLGAKSRIYHASSSECFGEVGLEEHANEMTPFRPRSPYGVAKASAHWLVTNYREAYGLFCCNGILFNHESPLRPARFVTRKIVSTACRIAAGSKERLVLGRLDIARDWGWSPDFVDAMWRMMQQKNPDDYVIATGSTHTLEEFVSQVFEHLGMDWHAHVDSDTALFRPSEIIHSAGDPSKAARVLEWTSSVSFPVLIGRLVEAELMNDTSQFGKI
ncbi:GDP-mannose 4,6-dehydratase [Herminiimonas sp. NPDC097707]|uniref:GDP-mannose 4,6-dehydratase n=1 Tax=Herminiimonas sp. NPDC097707 TaxID=3364007 RepID=UPI00383A1746